MAGIRTSIGRPGSALRSWLLAAAALFASAPALADAPYLRPHGTTSQLVVQGKPMLMLAGELGNSSASSAEYMAPHWARLRAMHLNTVLAPVSWELIEPVEGRYDWRSVDALIAGARAHDLHLVLLWFGAWKNSMSTYAPGWVKRDQTRFPRAERPDGQSVEILSAFAPATLAADAGAFAALLAHVRAVDRDRNTVLMAQVENEIGMLPSARDYGPLASAAFAQPVPAALTGYLATHRAALAPELRQAWEEHGARQTGSWADLFGESDRAAEAFTAWHYARYADAVAAAGKAQYPLPMYANVALNRPGRAPGEYPSGGPLPHLYDIWKAGAPHLDLLAPDIYFANFTDIATRYARPGNPLFVPEANNADRPEVPANALEAFGKLGAIGFGPFAIESVDEHPEALAATYAILEGLAPTILAAQGTPAITAVKPRVLYDGTVIAEPVTVTVGDWRFSISFTDIRQPTPTPEMASYGALIVQTEPDSFFIAGQGVTVTAEPVGAGPPLAGLERVEEGRFDAAGRWTPGRRLNGDQTNQGRYIRLWPGDMQVQRFTLYRYR